MNKFNDQPHIRFSKNFVERKPNFWVEIVRKAVAVRVFKTELNS